MNFQEFDRVHVGHGVFEMLHHIDMPHYGGKHWPKVDIYLLQYFVTHFQYFCFRYQLGILPRKPESSCMEGADFKGIPCKHWLSSSMISMILSHCMLRIRGDCSDIAHKPDIKKQHHSFKMFSNRVKNMF